MERVDYQSQVIQDIINLSKAGELDIKPWYQRRAVWKRQQKSYLINTIFERKPIPSVYVRHYINIGKEKSIKEIVDGQQRIRSILEYHSNSFAANHPDYTDAVKFSELHKNDKKKFLMTSLSIGFLIEASDEDVIEIFGRLNSVAKTLNAQEKRNAQFSGEMKQFCLYEAAKRVSFWRNTGIFSANNIARMNEIQFISDIVYNMINGLSDFKSKELDQLYEIYDESFPRKKSIRLRLEKVFEKLVLIEPSAIKDTIFARSPIFFSLFLFLDEMRSRKISSAKLEDTLFLIDEKFNSDLSITERKKIDADFYLACTSTTQRIKQRKTRYSYIKKHF